MLVWKAWEYQIRQTASRHFTPAEWDSTAGGVLWHFTPRGVCDECGWNYMDIQSRGPGFESRRLRFM